MGCGGSKNKQGDKPMEYDGGDSDDNSSIATEKKRHAKAVKGKIHPGMSQAEMDAALPDEFFDAPDEMSNMEIAWDENMDEFEFIDAPASVDAPALSGAANQQAENQAFNPNDEDSCRKHYLGPAAEWIGSPNAPKCGSYPGTDRKSVTSMEPNTWCAGYGESFKLRIGPNYAKYGKKARIVIVKLCFANLLSCFRIIRMRQYTP